MGGTRARGATHLTRVIRSHCGYYDLTGNSKRLSGFRYWVIRHWRKALARRSRAGRAWLGIA